jgi:trimeric autotransporter adhesin
MKKIFFLLITNYFILFANAQNGVAINATGTPPNSNAMLDVEAANKGLLIPRVNLVTLTTNNLSAFGISATPVTSLLVYNTTASTLPSTIFQTGFYYWDGSNWIKLNTGATSSAATGWTLTGNSGTNPTINFIGTVDDNDIVFKRNGVVAGRINSSLINTSIGLNTMANNTVGAGNAAFGNFALSNNISGSGNTAMGGYSLSTNTAGSANTATGYDALIANTTGNNNVAVGMNAMVSNNVGSNNVAIGTASLHFNTDKKNLVAIGDSALHNNGLGATIAGHSINNTAVGSKSLLANTTGSFNSGVGFRSLAKNTTGSENTAMGDFALFSTTTGNGNAAVGSSALENNTTGFSNVAVGNYALVSNTLGSNQVAIGDSALYNSQTQFLTGETGPYTYSPSNNTAIGSKALYGNTYGNNNTAIGSNAMQNSIADRSLAIGLNAFKNGGGFENIAIGSSSMLNASGGYNTTVGDFALTNNTGSFNTALGRASMGQNKSGGNNTALGTNSLSFNRTGNYNTAIGASANVRDTNFVNATAIGAQARVDCSNCLVLGSKSSINGATSDVNVGIGTTEPTTKLHVKNTAGGFGMNLESGTANNFLAFTNSAGYMGYAGSFTAATNLDFGTSGFGTDVNLVTGSVAKMTVKLNGKVGIGTTNPNASLEIKSTSFPSSPSLKLYDNNVIGYSRLQFQNASGPSYWQIAGLNSTVNANEVLTFSNSASGDLMSITGDGKVGVGTTNPTEKLSVTTLTNTTGITHTDGTIKLGTFVGGSANGGYFGTVSNHPLHFYTNDGSAQVTLLQNGNFGIGITNPAEKLAVNGRIRSKEVLVEAANWPDFVFDEKYALPILSEVEKFIAANKHLPNIPSANEVETNGQNLGDIQKKLLQKVEELTLYIIELNKRIEKLEAEKLKTTKN